MGKSYQEKKQCHDPGSNRGPLDLQSNALPTELSWHLVSPWLPPCEKTRSWLVASHRQHGTSLPCVFILDSKDLAWLAKQNKNIGPAEI